MSTTSWRAALLLLPLLPWLLDPSPPSPAAHGPEEAEARYHAVLALGRHDSAAVRTRLRALTASEEPLTRNAAARALLELGDEEAAATLIQNLHRDERTFVVTDAIHHLREIFGTDRGYEPNRGYTHQEERQAAWIAWYGGPLAARRERAEPEARAAWELASAAVMDLLAAFRAIEGGENAEVWVTASALWSATARIARSRDRRELSLVRDVFGAIAARFPDKVDAWNNHALASLNVGLYAEAEASYERALTLAPHDAYLHNDLGILLEAMGRLEEAEAQYRHAIRCDPDDDIWHANLADVLAKQGRREDAINAYRDAERLAPSKWHYHRLWISRASSSGSTSP